MKRRDEVAVGILLTVAVIVLITGTLWLVRGGLRRGYPLFVQFAWGHSIKQGQAVVLAGVTVGYVSDVRLNPTGVLDVDLTVRNQYKIPRTVVAEVYPVGIFGDVMVALRTTTPSTDVFAPGDTVPSRLASTTGLDALQAKADTIADALLRITKSLEAELVTGGAIRHVREAATNVNAVVADLKVAVDQQNRNMASTLASIRGAVDSAQVGETAAQMRATAANADSLMAHLQGNATQLQAILARLERGEGSAGRVLTDTTLYKDVRRVVTTADSLLSDIRKNPKKYFNFSIW